MAKRVLTNQSIISQLEPGLQIDEHDLDHALIAQPDLFWRVSRELALTISRRDAKKQEVSEVEARADASYRLQASKLKEKTTEPEIKAQVRVDPEVVECREELIRLDREVGELTALKEAFQQRSYVLKSLVELYIANYYTSNQEGGSSARAYRDHTADINRREMSAMRRKGNDHA